MPDLSGPAPTSHYHFDTLFDSFVINLKRQPEKLQTFIERNRSAGIDFQHFEAVDGAQCNIFDMIGGQVVARGAVNYTPGAIGNALSHLALWRRCVEQNKHFIIFEDDAVVRNDFKVRLSPLAGQGDDWDIILLGYNTDAVLELNIAPGIDLGGVFSIDYPTARQLACFELELEHVYDRHIRSSFLTSVRPLPISTYLLYVALVQHASRKVTNRTPSSGRICEFYLSSANYSHKLCLWIIREPDCAGAHH